MKRLNDHKLHDLLSQPTKNRLKRKSMNHHCKTLNRQYAEILQSEDDAESFQFQDWESLSDLNITIRTDIPGITSKQQSPDELRTLTLEHIDHQYHQDTWIHAYTDGSAVEAIKDGGSGVYIRFVDNSVMSLSSTGGRRCSNYRAELIAIQEAIEYLLECGKPLRKIVFLTDSMSALQALETTSKDRLVQILQTKFCRLSRQAEVTLQWVPSHVGLNGNEIADGLAKSGSLLPQPDVPLTFSEAKTALKRQMQKEWYAVTNGYIPEQDPIRLLERKQQTTIFRLRTGHCRLNAHLNKMGIAPSSKCHCGAPVQTPEHVLQACPLYDAARSKIWPQVVDLKTKLWGTKEDLCRTSEFTSSSSSSSFLLARGRRGNTTTNKTSPFIPIFRDAQ